MYGDRGREQWDSPDNKPKNYFKHREETLAITEAVEEIYEDSDEKHARGICYDPHAKMYGCADCYDGTDYYDASELDGIKGVWTDTERLIY